MQTFIEHKASFSVLVATNGDLIAEDSPKTFTNVGPSGAVDTVTITDIFTGYVYKKTLTYSGSSLVGDSGWVKQ